MIRRPYLEPKLGEASPLVWRKSRVSGELVEKKTGLRLRRGDEGYESAIVCLDIRKSRKHFVPRLRQLPVLVLAGPRTFQMHKVSPEDTEIELAGQVFSGTLNHVAAQLFQLYETKRDVGLRELRKARREAWSFSSPVVMIRNGAIVRFESGWTIVAPPQAKRAEIITSVTLFAAPQEA